MSKLRATEQDEQLIRKEFEIFELPLLYEEIKHGKGVREYMMDVAVWKLVNNLSRLIFMCHRRGNLPHLCVASNIDTIQ